jgi:carbonic anhydrase
MRRSRSIAASLVAAAALSTVLVALAVPGSRYWAYSGQTGPPFWA